MRNTAVIGVALLSLFAASCGSEGTSPPATARDDSPVSIPRCQPPQWRHRHYCDAQYDRRTDHHRAAGPACL